MDHSLPLEAALAPSENSNDDQKNYVLGIALWLRDLFCNHLNLYQCALRQRLDCNGGTCRIWFRKELGIDCIHVGKVVHVGQEHRCLDDTAQRQSCFFQYGLDVGERLAGLLFDASFCKHPCCRVDGNLSGGIYEISHLNGLAVWADGGRCLFGADIYG